MKSGNWDNKCRFKKSFFEEQFRIKVVTVFQEKEESSIEGGGELRWERREYVRK